MSSQRHPYELLAELLEYPGPGLTDAAEQCRAALAEKHPAAAQAVEDFAAWAAGVDPRDAEELYTRTFDIQAPCCLELGWQLFGETYKRGGLLVKLRVALREHDVEPGSELPDHLSVVLRLLPRLAPAEDPRGLVEEAVVPGVAKMAAALQGAASDAGATPSPYLGLLRAVDLVLRADYDVSADAGAASRPNGTNRLLPIFTPEMEP